MNLNVTTWTWDQWKGAGKHAASAAAGAVAFGVSLHLLSPGQGIEVTESVNHIVDGIKQIAEGLAGLAAVALAVRNGFKSAHNADPIVRKETVIAQNPGSVIVTSANFNATELANQIAKLPEAAKIESSPAVATATPSAKVVQPGAVAP